MRFLLTITFVLAVAAPAAAKPSDSSSPLGQNDELTPEAGAIRAHVSFLADDGLEGREAGTPGYDAAAAYVADQFERLSLRPAGADGTFLQRVPLRASKLEPETAHFRITGDGFERVLEYPSEVVLLPSFVEESVEITAEVVFAGYGVDAPAFGHNDYDGLDVEGRIVAILGPSARYPNHFPPEEGAHFSSRAERTRAAARHGAIGVLFVYDEIAEAVFSYGDVQTEWASGRSLMTWRDENGRPTAAAPENQLTAILSPESAPALFHGAQKSYEEVRAESVTAGVSPPGFPLAVTVTVGFRSSLTDVVSSNVAGVLEGQDVDLRDEFVVLCGHLDHVGIGPPKGGDQIYNGAMDNSVGIATMIEAARAFSENDQPPRRSVMFLAVTAEEKGLLGADFFANNPTVPMEQIVANVNLDMPIITYDFEDVVAYGASHSSLGAPVARAAEKIGVTLSPDPQPEQALFVRTDHYRFVLKGVPAIFLAPGFAGGGKAAVSAFFADHYHQPSDDLKLPLDYEAGAKFARLNYLIAREIADSDERPSWNPGDFFGDSFGRRR